MKIRSFMRQWISDWYSVFAKELKNIFSDSGVLVIFFLAGLAYPVLYNLIYSNGTLDGMPVAVVDLSGGSESRKFTRDLDATRELSVKYKCEDMGKARSLMENRKVNGIILIPEDYDGLIAAKRQAVISTYADMSSFLYYKNLTMGVNQVMLAEMRDMQSGILPMPVKYEENLPYNRTFSYTIFFLSAALLIVVQQTMFYGVSMLSGTIREEGRYGDLLPGNKSHRGVLRDVFGKSTAYWLIYMGIGIYVAILVPKLFGLPQNCPPGQIMGLLFFYVPACVMFSLTFSHLVRHRETVFIMFLFMSPICLFLTGFSWPESSFPGFWEIFSFIFPSTFGVRAFINMNTAGASLAMAGEQIKALTIQFIVYYLLACLLSYLDCKTFEARIEHTVGNDAPDASGYDIQQPFTDEIIPDKQ